MTLGISIKSATNLCLHFLSVFSIVEQLSKLEEGVSLPVYRVGLSYSLLEEILKELILRE